MGRHPVRVEASTAGSTNTFISDGFITPVRVARALASAAAAIERLAGQRLTATPRTSFLLGARQHGGGGASTSLASIALRPSGQVSCLKSIGCSVAFSFCAQRLRLQKSS